MKTIDPKTQDSVAEKRGTTLIEVMLSAVILAIFALIAVNSLFYPRLWVVNSSLEQSAIHAAIANIEHNLIDTNTVYSGTFVTDGWPINIDDIDIRTTNRVENGIDFGGAIGDKANYYEIHATVKFRDGKTVNMVTYRSAEMDNSQR